MRNAAYGQKDGRLMGEMKDTAVGVAIFFVLGVITGLIMWGMGI